MYSTLNRKLRENKLSFEELEQPKTPVPRVPRRAKQPAAKKARLDTRPVLEISEEEREQFEKEFADFDFSDDTLDQEQLAMQAEEHYYLELELEEGRVQEFLAEVKKMKDNIQDEGHPIQVSNQMHR